MTIAVLQSCLIMIDKSVKDTVPITVFETDHFMELAQELSHDLYIAAMKAGLPIEKFRIGKSDDRIEFFETTTKTEAVALLKQCEGIIFSKLKASAPSLDVDEWKNGVLAPEADAMVGRIQQLLDLRRMLRNFAALNESGGKKKRRLILYHSEINSRVV